jgi:macrolide-specific efflux system membrane fusion protein
LPKKTPSFMRSGMTANVGFVVAAHQQVLLVPSDAVKARDGHFYVLTPPLKSNGVPVERPVKTGLSDGKRSEVLEGLEEGDKLLVQRLRTGGRDDASSPLMPFGRKKK